MFSSDLFIGGIAAVIMVMITVFVHYEVLLRATHFLPKIACHSHRLKVLFVIFAVFLAHTIEVWLYALSYYLMTEIWVVAKFAGEYEPGAFNQYVYFSAVTYTSLGFGDIFPHGAARMLAGVEALNGLVMIGWSASFTYLSMEKFWKMPKN